MEKEQSHLPYTEGMTALDRGQLELAIDKLKYGLASPYDEPRIRNALGIALQRKGDLPNAIEQFRKVIEVDFASVDTHLNFGGRIHVPGRVFRD